MKTGIELIAEERQRQIEIEGYSISHDKKMYKNDELVYAATAYALPENVRSKHDVNAMHSGLFISLKRWWFYPFGNDTYKPTPNNRIKELQKAGALIAAEIDRLQHENVNV